MQARVEELIGVDLTNYAIAAADDCSERLNTYVNSAVLDAIQRSASKPWVSQTPYAKDACVPDLSVLLINAKRLGKELVEAVLWWNRVLNLSERFFSSLHLKCSFLFIYFCRAANVLDELCSLMRLVTLGFLWQAGLH